MARARELSKSIHITRKGSAGSSCIACHMPKIATTIADVKVRSHTFAFITPAMTDKYKIPNPCTSCHADKTTAWPRRSYGTGQSDRRGERSAPRDFSRSPGAIRSAGSELLVDVVFRFQALQQWLKKRLRRVRCRADRHRHFLGGVREITGVRRDSRERQVTDPVIRIFLWHLGKQLKCALGVPRALQAAGVRVQLNRAGFIKALGKHSGGFFFSAHGIEDARFGFQIFKSLFILNRSVFPFQRFFQVVIVVQAPLRGLVVTRPSKSADTPKLVFDAAQNNCFYVPAARGFPSTDTSSEKVMVVFSFAPARHTFPKGTVLPQISRPPTSGR